MNRRGKFFTSLLLFNLAVLTVGIEYFKLSGGYGWYRNEIERFFESRDWGPIVVMFLACCFFSIGIWLLLDSYGKLPGADSQIPPEESGEGDHS
jgi:hypothetical protein